MKDNSRQLEFMEIDLSEEPETAAVPVPDRSTIVQSAHDTMQHRGGILSSEKRFVEEAKRWAEMEGDVSPWVPFMSYWPTYGVMNDAQRKWYMFWRREVRQGRYPDTDLSYLFVHIYELINGIGWQNPQDGYDQLKQLWVNYRERLPQVNIYMQEWIVDYVLVHQMEMSLSEVMVLSGGYLPAEMLDRELQRILQDKVSDISLNMLQRYYDYDITLSKFYRDGGKEVMEQYIPRVMALVDSYLERTRQVGLLLECDPNDERTMERILFRKAVYDDSIYGRSVSFRYMPIGEQAEFVQIVTRIYRCTENKLRELRGFRGRLRGQTLEPELANLIERYLDKTYATEQAESVEQPVIRIDTEKLASLQQESEYVRMALTIEVDHASEVKDEEVNSANVTSNPFDVLEAREEITPTEDSTVPDPSAEEIVTGASAKSIELQWDESVEADLDEEWLLFAKELSPQQVQTIHVLLGANPDTELMRLAEQYGTMPALLLDEINDVAMETIGDLLIDGDRIVPDYIDVFEHVKR
ncbi:TerB N-terminal domain-containing protein [Paenibacillus xylanexedens]|uniref:TerB N-terminal domain-containing protein n=1 Tax=Paenibacillus xylanexedens TaxID=528191 RepID=UPI001C8E4C9B|nr:TerB N-terminal domain-containing protein [Paenibacillus xylanexedens]MBY0115502.1 TerB N-terminal domain-containing protein [Paenibacillus xylanexedens]